MLDIIVGQTATRAATVNAEMVQAYAEVTGDCNPLHFDPDFAGRTRFKQLIAQGGIATGLLHALVGMDMPGPGSVFISQQLSFPKPVYIGDTIRAEARVKRVSRKRHIAEIEFTVENQHGEQVLRGQATVYQAPPV